MAKSKRFADGGMVESTRDRMYREAMAAKTTAPTATPMLSAPLAAAPAPQLDEETEIRMGLQRDGFSRGHMLQVAGWKARVQVHQIVFPRC
jgi:hypothetical protein